MNKQLTYFIGIPDEDLLVSRCGSEVLFSQMCYEDFVAYDGEAVNAYEVHPYGDKENILNDLNSIKHGRWTKKIPYEWKNVHRTRWGLPPLKKETCTPEWYLHWNNVFIAVPENVDIPDELAGFFNGRSDSRRVHLNGDKEMFKTWCVTTPLSVVLEEIQPFLKGTDEFTLKLKYW